MLEWGAGGGECERGVEGLYISLKCVCVEAEVPFLLPAARFSWSWWLSPRWPGQCDDPWLPWAELWKWSSVPGMQTHDWIHFEKWSTFLEHTQHSVWWWSFLVWDKQQGLNASLWKRTLSYLCLSVNSTQNILVRSMNVDTHLHQKFVWPNLAIFFLLLHSLNSSLALQAKRVCFEFCFRFKHPCTLAAELWPKKP